MNVSKEIFEKAAEYKHHRIAQEKKKAEIAENMKPYLKRLSGAIELHVKAFHADTGIWPDDIGFEYTVHTKRIAGEEELILSSVEIYWSL